VYGAYAGGYAPPCAPPTAEQQLLALQGRAHHLEQVLSDINRRIEELEARAENSIGNES
jgi:hypothetical protein